MTLRTCYLHAGLPKTASSSLQLFLASNAEKLIGNGLLYPDLIDFNKHILAGVGQGNAYPIAYSLLDDKSVTRWNGDIDGILTLEKCLAQCNSSSNILFSTEWFTALGKAKLELIKECILRHGFKPIIISYVRPPHSWIESEVGQSIKIGNSIVLPTTRFTQPAQLYGPLSVFREVFGYESVINRPFISEYWLRSNLICDFLAEVGLRGFSGLLEDHEVNVHSNQKTCVKTANLQRALLRNGLILSVAQLSLIDSIAHKLSLTEPPSRYSWFAKRERSKIVDVHTPLFLEALASTYFNLNIESILEDSAEYVEKSIYCRDINYSISEVELIMQEILPDKQMIGRQELLADNSIVELLGKYICLNHIGQ